MESEFFSGDADSEGLYLLIASGDAQAFSRLHAAYKDRLLFYGRRFLDDWDEIQDVVSEAFLRLWEARREMGSDKHLSNFLYRTVRHRAIDLIRSKQRKANLIADMEPPEVSDEGQVEADRVRVELIHMLSRAVQSLPDKYRRVFELAYEEEKSHEEIAGILQMNPDTVRSQKRRALEMIRQWIRERRMLLLILCWSAVCVISKKNIHFFGTNEAFVRNNYNDTQL